MIKAIVFDIGGVLIRTEDRTGRLMLEEKYQLPPGGAEDLVFNSLPAIESTVGLVERDAIWLHVAEKLSLAPHELEAFKVAFWGGDQIDRKLLEYLEALKNTYTTAMLSNAWMNTREYLADQFQIIEGTTVDYLLISSELGAAKPDKKIYHILAERLKCNFDHILFIDDFLENIQAAQELGINTIHYQPGLDLISRIKSELYQN